MTGELATPAGQVPLVATRLMLRDKIGALRVRLAIGRMNYSIEPGLYAVGNPIPESPVFVTANYKLSFDILREALNGVDGWILVLDTKGINVWCAAGKGTFGTAELVSRVQRTHLDQVVVHHKLIVPQLGAPGISAAQVRKQCAFQIIYGPVRAGDIPAFLASQFTATPAMRRVAFTLRDRFAVIPVELIIWFKQALGLAVFIALLEGFSGDGFRFAQAARGFGVIAASWLAGGTLVPILLPWLPGRAFSIKGIWVALALWLALARQLTACSPQMIGEGLLLTAVISFMALNFTGASTYTSMSGVKKEMKIAIPIQFITAVAGIVLIVSGGFR